MFIYVFNKNTNIEKRLNLKINYKAQKQSNSTQRNNTKGILNGKKSNASALLVAYNYTVGYKQLYGCL